MRGDGKIGTQILLPCGGSATSVPTLIRHLLINTLEINMYEMHLPSFFCAFYCKWSNGWNGNGLKYSSTDCFPGYRKVEVQYKVHFINAPERTIKLNKPID